MYDPAEIIGETGNAADKLLKGFDSLFTSDEERIKAHALIAANLQQFFVTITEKINEANKYMEEAITSRHKADMQSDSALSKNIRPLCLIFVVSCFVAMVVFENVGWQVEIRDRYIDMLEYWGGLIFGFYFGGRSAEKIGRGILNHFKNKEIKKPDWWGKPK